MFQNETIEKITKLKNNTEIILGIDPDCLKSGVAILEKPTNTISVRLYGFFELFEYLLNNRIKVVYIECGWLNTAFYTATAAKTSYAGKLKIAANIGANHETGKKIIEMLEYLNIKFQCVKPNSKKWTPQICKAASGLDLKNQDLIDAVKLVIGR